MPQMAEKTSPDAPPNCAVVPEVFILELQENLLETAPVSF